MRSTHTNALIRAVFSEHHNIAVVYNEDTGEYDETCNGFRELANQIDNLDEIRFKVLNMYSNHHKGWFYLIMSNDGNEQLSDYSANGWAENLVENIKITGDE